MADKLTAKQDAFCREYVVDSNGTQAAIRAGYSPKTANREASRLLSKVDVVSRIRLFRDERARSTAVDAAWVLDKLTTLAGLCMEQEKPDSAGANRSLELIGKHLGLFGDKLSVEVNEAKAKAYARRILAAVTANVTDPATLAAIRDEVAGMEGQGDA